MTSYWYFFSSNHRIRFAGVKRKAGIIRRESMASVMVAGLKTSIGVLMATVDEVSMIM